jgi:hypothetical protein
MTLPAMADSGQKSFVSHYGEKDSVIGQKWPVFGIPEFMAHYPVKADNRPS